MSPCSHTTFILLFIASCESVKASDSMVLYSLMDDSMGMAISISLSDYSAIMTNLINATLNYSMVSSPLSFTQFERFQCSLQKDYSGFAIYGYTILCVVHDLRSLSGKLKADRIASVSFSSRFSLEDNFCSNELKSQMSGSNIIQSHFVDSCAGSSNCKRNSTNYIFPVLRAGMLYLLICFRDYYLNTTFCVFQKV
jgi:hypothetical protein